MIRTTALFVLSSSLASGLVGMSAAPTRPPGIVVESVDATSPPGRAGIRAGDILLSWERAANPPSNPAPARGNLATPMDLEEVCIEESQRGRLKILGMRNGRTLSFAIPTGFWDAFQLFDNPSQLQAHPQLIGKSLARYLDGLKLIERRDFEGGAEIWRALAIEQSKLSHPEDAAWLWFRLGTTLSHENKFNAAQAAFEASLGEARKSRMDNAASQVLYARGRLFRVQKDLDRSLGAFDESRRFSYEQRVPSLFAAEAFVEEGGMLRLAGRLSEGIEYLRKAVELSEKAAPEASTRAMALLELAICNWELGDFEASERQARRAIAIFEKSPRANGLVRATLTLGATLIERRDLAAADTLHRQLLALTEREYPGTAYEAYAAGNLGDIALRRGDLVAAEQYLLRDLALEEKINAGTVDHAACLTSLGDVAEARGDIGGAESYYQRSFEIQHKLSGDSINVTNSLDGLGRLAMKRGDRDSAAAYFRRALEIQEQSAPGGLSTAMSLDGLGDAAVAGGELETARQLYERALTLFEKLSPDGLPCARTLHNLGLLQHRTGNLNEAARYLSRAIDVLESQKRNLGGTQEVQSLFAASHADYYRDYIEVLIELGKKEDAFRTLERSRARALLAMLAERDLVFSADVPPELERERKLTDAAYDKAQNDLRDVTSKDAEKQEEALAQLRQLRQKQEQIAGRLKQASPRYGALQYPKPMDVEAARESLDSGTLLLSYSIGKEKSYLFAVASDPKRGPPLSIFTLPVGEKALRESVKAFRKLIEWRETSPELVGRARSLYDALLKPAEPLIAKCERLLILPDGPLHTLPWGALARGVESGRPQYLLEWKPVHITLSATLHAELKRERHPAAAPAVDVAAFGDPKYPKLQRANAPLTRSEADEPPDNELETDEEGVGDPQLRSVLRGGFRFDPLPETRKEVEQIASLYAPKSVAYLGPDATEEKAKSIGKDVPLIHYACHAIVNERFPLDSALVFTIPEHPKEGQDNGLLQAWEIFERVRIDADLITLSACESGLGKEMGGEGLIGLTRAFQYAGARSVLASLWKVEDRATGELMKRFYTYLKSGKTKDEALRSAQIDMIHSTDFSQPKDWAAFQLNGDWK